MSKLRRILKNKFDEKADSPVIYSGKLGDGLGTVNAGNGKVYVRISNTVNTALCSGVPYINNLDVWVGYTADLPTVLRVLGQQPNQSSVYFDGIGKHARQHEWMGQGVGGGTDVLSVHLQQFLPLMVFPYSEFIVGVYPGIAWTTGGYKLIADINSHGKPVPKIIDLRSYFATTNKELYVLIGLGDDGNLEVVDGEEVDKGTLTLDNIPASTSTMKYKLAAVRRYNDQYEIVVNRETVDIVDLRFPMWRAPNYNDLLDIPTTFPPEEHVHDQYMIDLLDSRGQLLSYYETIDESYIENANQTGILTISGATATDEAIIPNCTLEITEPTISNVTIKVNVWVSKNHFGSAKTVRIRVRRDDLAGAILWSAGYTSMTIDSSAGHNIQFTTEFIDEEPTTFKYVLTVQTEQNSAVYSDTREFSIEVDSESHPYIIDVGTEGQHLVVNNLGYPAWADDTGGGASALADLTDVDLTGLADGDVLIYDEASGDWLPETPASGSSLTVQEIDTTPSVANVSVINITNGTLTDDGGGEITIDFGSAATDGSAIHDNEANEISGVTEKTTPADDDLLLIEDSEASYVKKSVKISNLPGGSSGMENPMTTAGDIIYGGASGTPTRLAKGTEGHYLKQGATNPEWAASAGGGVETGWPEVTKTTPDLDDFAWINQGTATAVEENGGIYLYTPADANFNYRILKKAAPATPYTITALFIPTTMSINYSNFGLCFRESGSGKIVRCGLVFNNTWNISSDKLNSPTSYNAAYQASVFGLFNRVFFRIADNGTNRIFSVSHDGSHFITIHTVGRTDFLTANEVGFYVHPQNATFGVGALLLSWVEE